MDLRKLIKSKFGSLRQFGLVNNITQQQLSYWVNKDWHKMSYKLRCKITDLLLANGIKIQDNEFN